MERLLAITTVPDFRREIERSDEPTIVMFTTSWCPFCRRFKTRFVEAATKSEMRCAMVFIDDWENPLWDEAKVDGAAPLVLVAKGKPLCRRDGVLGRGLGDSDLAAIAEFGSAHSGA